MQSMRKFLALNTPGGLVIDAVDKIHQHSPLRKWFVKLIGSGIVRMPYCPRDNHEDFVQGITEALHVSGFKEFCSQRNIVIWLDSCSYDQDLGEGEAVFGYTFTK